MGHICRAVYRIHGGCTRTGLSTAATPTPRALQRADAKSMSLRQSAISAITKPPSSICAAHRGLLLLDSPAVRHTRGWTLERSATVSKHVSWENQVAEANKQRNEAEELMRDPFRVQRNCTSTNASATCCEKSSACCSMSVLPCWTPWGGLGVGTTILDWVRSERKKVRDEQFRLRC